MRGRLPLRPSKVSAAICLALACVCVQALNLASKSNFASKCVFGNLSPLYASLNVHNFLEILLKAARDDCTAAYQLLKGVQSVMRLRKKVCTRLPRLLLTTHL